MLKTNQETGGVVGGEQGRDASKLILDVSRTQILWLLDCGLCVPNGHQAEFALNK